MASATHLSMALFSHTLSLTYQFSRSEVRNVNLQHHVSFRQKDNKHASLLHSEGGRHHPHWTLLGLHADPSVTLLMNEHIHFMNVLSQQDTLMKTIGDSYLDETSIPTQSKKPQRNHILCQKSHNMQCPSFYIIISLSNRIQ